MPTTSPGAPRRCCAAAAIITCCALAACGSSGGASNRSVTVDAKFPRGPSVISGATAERLRVATCMRAHGIAAFPDPTTTPPADPAAYAVIDDTLGVYLAVPSSIDVNGRAYVRAAHACGFDLVQ